MDASRPSIRCCHTAHQGTRGSPPQSYTAGGERTSNNLESYREFRGAHLWMPQVSPTDEPLAGASNLRTRAQGKLTDGQDAEKGGARHKKSGEQAAKNISAHVQQRTCVVGEGGSSRKAKQDPRQHVLAAAWTFPYKTDDRNCWKIKNTLKSLIGAMPKRGKKVAIKWQKLTRKLRLLQRVTRTSLRSG